MCNLDKSHLRDIFQVVHAEVPESIRHMDSFFHKLEQEILPHGNTSDSLRLQFHQLFPERAVLFDRYLQQPAPFCFRKGQEAMVIQKKDHLFQQAPLCSRCPAVIKLFLDIHPPVAPGCGQLLYSILIRVPGIRPAPRPRNCPGLLHIGLIIFQPLVFLP